MRKEKIRKNKIRKGTNASPPINVRKIEIYFFTNQCAKLHMSGIKILHKRQNSLGVREGEL